MNIFRTFVFLLISLAGFGQPKEPVVAFEDYRACKVGFRTEKGDTIWKAEFTITAEIRASYLLQRSDWLVVKDGLYGVLDRYGDIQIPFQYSNLVPLYERGYLFATDQQGKTGIISLKNEVLVAFEYDKMGILFNKYPFIEAVRNGKTGVLDSNFREVIPFVFSNVRIQDRRRRDLYETYSEEGQGLYSAKLGEITPPRYRKIEIIQFDTSQYRREFFRVEDKDENHGVIDQNGRVVVPPKYAQIKIYCDFVDRERQHEQYFAVCLEQKMISKNDYSTKYYVYNLMNGESSEPYDRIQALNDKVICTRGNNWFVLDEHCKIIISGGYRGLKPLEVREYDYTDDYSQQTGRDVETISPYIDDSVVMVYDTLSRHSLLNVYTGKRIGGHYDELFSTKPGFYTDVYEDDESAPYGRIDIYDSAFDLVGSYKFQRSSEELFPKYEEVSNDRQGDLLLFKNEKGKSGGINRKGEVVLSFEYDNINFISKWDRGYSYNDMGVGGYYRVKKDSLFALFDTTGKAVLPLVYAAIRPSKKGYWEVKRAQQRSLLSPDFQPMVENCDELFCSLWHEKDFGSGGQEIGSYLFNWFIVRSNKLYRVDGKNLVLLDSTKLKFSEPVRVINNDLLVARNGSVLGKADGMTVLSGALMRFNQKKYSLTFLSFKGDTIVHLENVRSKEHSYGHLIEVEFTNSKKGLIDPNNGDWVIAPKYKEILSEKGDARLSWRYWGLVDAPYQKNEIWQVQWQYAKEPLEQKYDYPINCSDETAIFRYDNKFGIISRCDSVLLKPVYDLIFELNDVYFFKRDNLWGAWTAEGKIIEPRFSSISTMEFTKGIVAFEGEKITVLNSELEALIPLSTKDSIVSNIDVSTILGLWPHYSHNYLPLQLDREQKINPIYYRLSKGALLELARYNSTENQYLESKYNPHLGYRQIAAATKFQKHNTLEIEVVCKTFPYYSEIHVQKLIDENAYSNSGLKNGREFTQLLNYRLVNGKPVPIQLSDLFRTDVNASIVLDSLLIDQVNKAQLFGPECVDLDLRIQELKKTFLLSDEGIYFGGGSPYSNYHYLQLALPYSSISHILKEPEVFIKTD